jgi:putative endonuclease
MFWVYVLKNELSGKIYIGQTNDLEKRLKRHKGSLPSKSESYTKINKGTWIVVYREQKETREEALKREKYLKSHHGRDWIKKQMGR